ncbi:ABC transporter permease [Ectobacillus ponti]|uniref:ABC-2 family transporter protein n=1 Tax=Ectobacillus ponti TaxID=2961894 RepID=A0AA41X4N4_9BACI|nr:ABC-2 family transporter protein [Ectobacillus ponti]MCP8967113.1 ABC-2 family transporter protein [Ectobacillus ponti]
MKLYWRYITILFKAQMQYRASFWLVTIGQFFIPLAVFAGLYLLFARFGQVKGWDFYEVALCFGVIHSCFAASECFIRGFDSFSGMIVKGEFDRLLVRPRSTVLQVLGSKFEFTRVGRLLQGLVVLVWALLHVSVEWTVLKVLTLCFMLLGGLLIFSGIYILMATVCFWTVQGLEVTNIFTDGGREMAQYPLNIYQKWLTQFFTYVIPFGTINYIPLMYILGKSEGHEVLAVLAPLLGGLFILPCLILWHIGVRHYRSTGS